MNRVRLKSDPLTVGIARKHMDGMTLVQFDYVGPLRFVWLGDDLIEDVDSQPERCLMHYRNGREAKNGDKIVSLGFDGAKIVAIGILHDAVPGNDYCNGSIAPINTGLTGACMCDCLHIDDVAALLKEKGLDKRPAGK
jgi:hypothetical protein